MDKYFFLVDENLISVLVMILIGFSLSAIIGLTFEKYFKTKWGWMVFFVWIIIRSIIGGYMLHNDNRIFIKSKINSVVIENFEWRADCYRMKLKNGVVFYPYHMVYEKDSIVKQANSKIYEIYRIEFPGNYVLAKKDTMN